jgi:hypothetical protein
MNDESQLSGDRSGFLARLNGKATVRSVIRSTCITCVIAAALWLLCLIIRPNPDWRPNWITFAWWLACAALVGAVCEWQIPDDDDEQSPSGGTGG